jgi:ribonuclease HIII
MTVKQDRVIDDLRKYIAETGLEVVEEREIDYGRQIKVTDGTDVCSVNVYTSGKTTVGGKSTDLKKRVEEWRNLQQAGLVSTSQQEVAKVESRASKYVVSLSKLDRIREWLHEFPMVINWYEGTDDTPYVYRAELHSDSSKVVVTQYRTGTLMVQGRISTLFDEVCTRFDKKLSQSIPERAASYIPEEVRTEALKVMSQPETEKEALDWVDNNLGEDIYNFLYEHDRETLLSATALLQTVEKVTLKLPDYSVLVMPFARAYEGFLLKLFCKVGLADEATVEADGHAIQIGKWLEEIEETIVDKWRHRHVVYDLDTAWSGCRNLLMHSDPGRDVRMENLDQANREIGVVVRGMERGYQHFIADPIAVQLPKGKPEAQPEDPQKAEPVEKKQDVTKIKNVNEEDLLERLKQAGHQVEHDDNPDHHNKWRVMGPGWKIFCPRHPGDLVIVKGGEKAAFLDWYANKEAVEESGSPGPVSHIGVDEAGKGDFFGPLVVGAVHVTAETALELIRLGVKDSKTLSDRTIAELALEIRERCPNTVILLSPPDYNAAYASTQNLNTLLANLHAQAIEELVTATGCRKVVDDQFAAKHVMEEALNARGLELDLEQRTGGESDVAVAAASILAREAFVAAIEDYRVKSGLEIPLGSSSPKVVEIGKVIVQRWGPKALERIAKLNFKTRKSIV